MTLAAKVLWQDEGKEALTYLKEKRGLSEEVIREFNFGYCPATVSHQLAGRIIMPLYDSYGSLIAITTRHPTCPKQFQHWHESFDKGFFLFGLNVAKPYIYKANKAIIVEGQFDTTCLHSYGFKMTAGILGSTFNIMHVTLLARMCSEIFVVLDPDKSGDAGMERTIQASIDYNLEACGIFCIPVHMPEKMDPDDFVMKYGPISFKDLLRKSKEKFIQDRDVYVRISNA